MTTRAPNPSIAAVGIGALVLIGGALWFGLGTSDAPPPRPDVDFTAVEPDSWIAVHVSGAVLNPGVVTVPPRSRVLDVVVSAGGATHSADLTRINLAATVRDGERVVVPFVGEIESESDMDVGVDINAASAVGLEELPGVGPVLAARIVAYREEHGRFDAVEDLLEVPGIGEAKLTAMRDSISAP